MSTVLQRLGIELKDLTIKMDKLRNVLFEDMPDDISPYQIFLMERQLFAMEIYESVLDQRIEELKGEENE